MLVLVGSCTPSIESSSLSSHLYYIYFPFRASNTEEQLSNSLHKKTIMRISADTKKKKIKKSSPPLMQKADLYLFPYKNRLRF